MIQNIFDSLLHILGQFVPTLQENGVLLYAAALTISTIFFFLIREIVAWYWKVNKITMILERIEADISDTNFILRANSKANTSKQNSVENLKKELEKDKGLF